MCPQEEQSGIDLGDIRRSQDTIKENLDSVQREIFDKMPRSEVDEKLEGKFQEIVDHLQSALNSTAKDEDDFKAVTANLNQVCESLKSDKADKTEIASLRKQFLQHQSAMLSDMSANNNNDIDVGGPESMDEGEIKEYLKHYLTRQEVHKELGEKADKNVELVVGGMQGEIGEIGRALQQVLGRLGGMEADRGNLMNEMKRMSSMGGGGGMIMTEGGGGVEPEGQVAGGEWKGLAGAMRMDASNQVSTRTPKRERATHTHTSGLELRRRHEQGGMVLRELARKRMTGTDALLDAGAVRAVRGGQRVLFGRSAQNARLKPDCPCALPPMRPFTLCILSNTCFRASRITTRQRWREIFP